MTRLLHPEPAWRAELLEGENGGVRGHARLLGGCVAGCWFALDRASGERLWTRGRARANDIFGVDGDVLVGTQVLQDGQLAVAHGAYGISLGTGDLLWSHETERPPGWLARLFGPHPPAPDGPLAVQHGRVITRARLALDARTGQIAGRDARAGEEPPGHPDEELSSELFFLRVVELPGTGLRLLRRFDPKDPMEHLRHERCSHPEPVPMNFGAIDGSDRVVWERRYGGDRLPGTHWFGSRLVGGRLVVVERDARRWQLAVLDAATGQEEQTLDLPGPACIQDADDRGLLLGLGSELSASIRALAYLQREASSSG